MRTASVVLMSLAALLAVAIAGLDLVLRAVLAFGVVAVAARSLRHDVPRSLRLFADRSLLLDPEAGEPQPAALVDARPFGPWTLLALSCQGRRRRLDLWPDMLVAAERKALRRRLRALPPSGAASAAAG